MRPTRAAIALVAFSLAAAPAAARPGRAAHAAARARRTGNPEAGEARRHAESARILFELQEYDAAVEEWKEAYRLKASPLLLFNIAQATRMSGRLHEARRAYVSYLKAIGPGPGPKNGPPRSEVELRIAELEARLAPADGASGRRPAVTGAETVAAAKDATEDAVRPAPSPSAPTGTLPPPTEDPLDGRADLLVPDLRAPVRATAAAKREIEPPLPVYVAPPRPTRIAAAAFGVAGVGLAVAGAFYQFQARTLETDATAIERPRSELDARLREADAVGAQALWLGAGALAAGACALGLWWWDRASGEPR
jgi:hypothetical protein